jgi:hypothetical protein
MKLWWNALLSGTKVTAQFSKFETIQKLFIYVLIAVYFVLLNPNTQVSFPTVISKPMPFLVSPMLHLSLT